MADHARKTKSLKDIVEDSKLWDPEDLLRNIDAEMERFEQGMEHMIWSLENRPISRCCTPLPVTPKFKVKEGADKFNVKVELPGVPEDLVRIRIDSQSVEVSACTDDPVCRPYYVSIESKGLLNPEKATIRHTDSTVEVEVDKANKKKVKMK